MLATLAPFAALHGRAPHGAVRWDSRRRTPPGHGDHPPNAERVLLHTGADDAAHRLRECRRRNAEVDETRPGDLDRCDRGRLGQPRHDALGDLARLAPGDAREGEGDGAREVAVAIPAAALDRNVGQRIEREVPVVAKCRQRVLEERSDVLLH